MSEGVKPGTIAAIAALLAFILPFPGESLFSPLVLALRDIAFGDVGHGTRFYWLSVVLAVWAVYTVVIYILFVGLRYLARKFR